MDNPFAPPDGQSLRSKSVTYPYYSLAVLKRSFTSYWHRGQDDGQNDGLLGHPLPEFLVC